MKRSLSGIQPSGILHLGNYFGAIDQFIKMQDDYEGFYFVADYHSLTSQTKPENLRENTKNIILDYLALGLDPNKSNLFLQSDVPEHLELYWLLCNVTPTGLLERAHSYKDKITKGFYPNMGLFNYPALMAADILIYDSDVVPVGKDQKQHLEMTRDIAMKFNQQYEVDFLKLPTPLILNNVAVIPGTDGQKMSKSYGNTIQMFTPKKQLKQQIMSIVTDSTSLEDPKDPDNNIAKLYAFFANTEKQNEMKEKFLAGNYGYGHAKAELLNAMLDFFGEARDKREELSKNPKFIEEILYEGAKKARTIASKKVQEAKEIVGLLGNVYR